MSMSRQLSSLVLHDKPIPSLCSPAPNANGTKKKDDGLSRIYRYTPTPTIVLDASMTIVEVSNSHRTLSGRTRDQLLHTSIGDLPPTAIPAPNIPTVYGALRAACTTKEPQEIESISLPGQASYVLRVTPIFEDSNNLLYIVLEAHVVSPEAAETHHAYLNETYKILVDTVQDYAIFMLDPRGHIATWNSGAAILKGYSTEEIVGQHFSVFYSPEDRRVDKPGKGLARCLREGRIEDEGWRYRRDGSRFWANVMITPVHQFGQHVGFVKVTRDLTERKAAEARMIDAFEESSKLKTDFLASISHEIRTPMNGMHLALTMLANTELDESQRQYTAIIEDSTSVLLQIVNDVLDYSKLSSGSFSLHADVVDVESLVGAVVRNCHASLKPGVQLSVAMSPGFPKLLRGDPLRYRQVLQNLVGNAVKFTEKGYVRVLISFARDTNRDRNLHRNTTNGDFTNNNTDTDTDTNGDHTNTLTHTNGSRTPDPPDYIITTEVQDSGIGVPDSAINTLFTPFTRLAHSITRKYPGTGLGLSICKSLAELMAGTVGFRPNPDTPGGSIFWFTAKMGSPSPATLPLSKPSSPTIIAQGTATPSLMEQVRKIAPRKHILIVEDNLINHTVLLKLLQTLGFERIDGAWNGAEAVRMVQQKPLSYNVVLMDVNMPVMDGMTATTRIREMGVEVPIIAITGNALSGDSETCLAKGMNDYIGKPIHRDQLLQALWRWMGT